MIDITNETHPFPISTWQVPVGNFCDKGGRFGTHQHAETVNGEINRFEDKLAINDVDIDHRGLAYASDRAGTGLFVLQYAGKPTPTLSN